MDSDLIYIFGKIIVGIFVFRFLTMKGPLDVRLLYTFGPLLALVFAACMAGCSGDNTSSTTSASEVCDMHHAYRAYGEAMRRYGESMSMCGWLGDDAQQFVLCTTNPTSSFVSDLTCNTLEDRTAGLNNFLTIYVPPASQACTELESCNTFFSLPSESGSM